jgi:M6 family metalloprotease-like protein
LGPSGRDKRDRKHEGVSLKPFRIALAAALALVVTCVVAGPAASLEPPRPGEVAKYQKDGSLPRRLARARELGNEDIVPGMLRAAVQRLQRAQMGTLLPLQTPPPAWLGMPTKGTVNVLAVPISFGNGYPPNYPPYTTQADLADRLFGDGDPADFPYESVHNYYARSSYGQLDIQGDVLPWYDAGEPRPLNPPEGYREALIERALDAHAIANPGWDAAKYDNDGDGVIDYLVVIWTGPHSGWSGFWWGYQTYFGDPLYEVGGRRLGTYSWQWEHQYAGLPPDDRSFDPLVTIHETGHALGLPDYYDYAPGWGPDGGVGGLDMMDYNWGDHNVFSKWLLDWLTPQIVGDGYGPVALAASAAAPEALVVMPGVTTTTAFQEYFIIENRRRVGNNDVQDFRPLPFPADGLLIWHVDARLYPTSGHLEGYDYLYDNSYTPHKLLRLMEADGLEEIRAGGWADAGDFYTAGDALGPATTPSGFAYGKAKAVVVRDIGAEGDPMTLFASTDWAPPSTTAGGAPSGWTRSPVTLSLAAADTDSGVASTGYALNGGPWTAGTVVELPADRTTHANDGVHTVDFGSIDNAGNVEAARRLKVRIDTTGPRARAPLAASARRGATAKLAYSVGDALSPRADVTIKVRRLSGRVVRTLRAPGVTTGVRHTRSFACTLARGTYRFQVLAVDLAGNRQVTVGWNTLRVR